MENMPIKKKHSLLSILAFIFSLTLYLSFVGIILAIIDVAIRKNDKKHVLSYVALGIGSVFTLISCGACVKGMTDGTVGDITIASQTVDMQTEPTAEATSVAEQIATTEEPLEKEIILPEPVNQEEVRDPIIGKDISQIYISFSKSVRNDKTGNWRIAQFAEAIDFNEYAVSYYQKYFKSDDEVHFVINRTYGTISRLNAVLGEWLYITTFEYVEGEEHDANQLMSGMMLSNYVVSLKTGEIEKITNE